MNYAQIKSNTVFQAITNGYNVVICDFTESKIFYTNELTVETIRTYVAMSGVAFFRVENASTD